MGQYHHIVNLSKHQFLHPHIFDNGLKLREFSGARNGTMAALAVLLASSNGRGGGDFPEERVPSGLSELIGSWAGDRIVISGDYDDPGRFFVEAGITEAQIGTAITNAHKQGWRGADDEIQDDLNLYHLCALGVFQDISGMVIDLFKAAGVPITVDEEARRSYCV